MLMFLFVCFFPHGGFVHSSGQKCRINFSTVKLEVLGKEVSTRCVKQRNKKSNNVGRTIKKRLINSADKIGGAAK